MATESLGRAPGELEEAASWSIASLVLPTTPRLEAMHKNQVHREPWPRFDDFDPAAHPFALRRAAAVQWAGRARNEHGSVHQFAALAHAFTEARVPAPLLGALARLITDEVRHAELCARTALAVDPDGLQREPAIFRFPVPRAPWPAAPQIEQRGSPAPILRWASDVVLTACCLGETLSRPMLAAVETVTTDPVIEAVAGQILRDEHLHATFGWEALGWLLPQLDDEGRAWLEGRLPGRFAGFERSTARGVPAEQIADREIVIAPGAPNLGTLDAEQYAVIFFATFEHEILPKLRDLGLDADRAWAARLSLLDA